MLRVLLFQDSQAAEGNIFGELGFFVVFSE
jgi:hypothetical protein